MTSAQLTSTVERGGSHLACPGQVVVLTCSETGSVLLLWASANIPDITFTADDEEGKEEVAMVGMNTFTFTLTETVMEGSGANMTSTMMLTFIESLDGLTVECRTQLLNGEIVIRMASVEMTGIRCHHCRL